MLQKTYRLLIIFTLFFLTIKSYAQETKSNTQDINQLKSIVQNPKTTFVDVRIPEQYKEGTANNAINIPLADIEKNLDFFKKQKEVVVFCNRGRQAQMAIEILNKNGINYVINGVSWQNVKALQEQK